jgi:hypothetical protein
VAPRGGEVIGEHRIEVFTGSECTPTVKRGRDIGRTSSAPNPFALNRISHFGNE